MDDIIISDTDNYAGADCNADCDATCARFRAARETTLGIICYGIVFAAVTLGGTMFHMYLHWLWISLCLPRLAQSAAGGIALALAVFIQLIVWSVWYHSD
jgi:hypothetical protein